MKKLLLILLCVPMIGFGQVLTGGKHGCVSGSCYNGYGTYISLATGSKYVGEYRNNAMSGEGTYTSTDGSEYIREWEADKRIIIE